ncbi:PLP-dependent aminotransferase family protein [Bacillus sp. A116_S68]|nr:PLP-dependent aminotransferase family protein [Bacillus sp. A116_S68]
MLWINIDRTLKISLKRQVYEQLRMKILRGELSGGERLPSSREFASHLGVSRNVVIDAYEHLLAEGYVEGQQGAGTFVAEGAYLDKDLKSRHISFLDTLDISENESKIIDFRSGIPALDKFPRQEWGRLAKRVCLEAKDAIFGYDYPEGRSELRHVLCRYLKRTRGVLCHPDQLVITSGATQALSLVAKLLLSKGDHVIMEDPITHEIQTIFSSAGGSLYGLPVDEHGMRTDYLPHNLSPSFIFVTPSHQFPLGSILPIQRRIELIQYANKTNCYIVEDDYDSEFRFQGSPISSLQGLEPERVIYIGTFSKILSPALRLGYLILPPTLTERCKNLKWFDDLHTPSLEQMTLARFIDQGQLESHIRKMRKLYQKRREVVRKSLKKAFGEKVKISGDSTGLHLIVEFINFDFTEQALTKINNYNIKVYPVELHTMQKGKHKNKLILGYGNLTKEEIEEGIYRLKKALEDIMVN